MKIVAYTILGLVIVLQISIGYSIKTGGSWIAPILKSVSESDSDQSNTKTGSQPVVQDVLNAPMVPYTKSDIGLAFSYPSVWPISTKAEDRSFDPTLIESFSSQDDIDLFYEGIYVNYKPVPEGGMEEYFNVLRGNLAYQKLKIVSESDRLISGHKAYVWTYDGTVEAVNKGDPAIPTRWILYIVEYKKNIYTFEFADQISTYDTTVKKMEEVIASVSIKK